VKINQVRADAQSRITRLNQQEQDEINALGMPVIKNGHTYWAPDPQPVNSAYKARIDDVNKHMEKKNADLNAECKSRVVQLEQRPASGNLHVTNTK
jgi:hypothetical protein